MIVGKANAAKANTIITATGALFSDAIKSIAL
jgi:hypothetical protein